MPINLSGDRFLRPNVIGEVNIVLASVPAADSTLYLAL